MQEGNGWNFTVRFNPSSLGTHTATVTIEHNDPDDNEDPYTFTIIGVGLGSPEIAVYGAPLLLLDGILIPHGDTTPALDDGTDFGTPDVNGPPTTKVFRIRNSGNTTLTVSITDDSSSFSVSNVAASIPGGGFNDFNITFDPAESGSQSATISIDNNDPDGNEDPYTFQVRGNAVAPEISVVGGPLFDLEILDEDSTPRLEDRTDFGEALVTGGAVERTFRIRNLQPSDGNPLTNNLSISSITTNDSQFAVLLFAPVLIQEEGSGDFTIRFDPDLVGTQKAFVTIVHNDPDGGESPYDFAISGVGVGEPDIQVSSPLLLADGIAIANGDLTPSVEDGTDWGGRNASPTAPTVFDPQRSFRVRNTGTAPLRYDVRLRPIEIGNDPSTPFEAYGDENDTVPPGEFREFVVAFSPYTSGLKQVMVEIHSNDPDEDPYTFLIQGEGRGPEIEVFGGPDFSLSILNGDFSPEEADGTDFGDVVVGRVKERTFRIRNLETEDGDPSTDHTLIVPDMSLPGDDFFRGSIFPESVFTPPVVLGPGQFFDFIVRFAPTTPGPHMGTVHILNNDPDGEEAFYDFGLAGNALPRPEIEVYGGPIPLLSDGVPIANGDSTPSEEDGTDFGNAVLPIPLPTFLDPGRFFRIRNSGTVPLDVEVNLRSIEVGNDEFVPFFVPLEAEATVPPGGFFDFLLYFRAHTSGPKLVEVQITSNDPDVDPYTFLVQGVATAPEIEVFGGPDFSVSILSGDDSPQAADGTDFGDVELGSFEERTFRIRNLEPDDNDPTTINSLVVRLVSHFNDGPDRDFSPGSLYPTLLTPVAIGPGQFFDIVVRFEPLTAGAHFGSIVIFHNDPDDDEAGYQFRLAGNALHAQKEIEVYGAPIPFISDGIRIFDGDDMPRLEDSTDFGFFQIVGILSQTSHTFRLKNTGTGSITPNVASSSSVFDITGLLPTIPPGAFNDINIHFSSAISGQFDSIITIADQDSGEELSTFHVTAEAIAPEIHVAATDVEVQSGDETPDAIDGTHLGEVQVGGNPHLGIFRISNSGRFLTPISDLDDLIITSISIDSPHFGLPFPPLGVVFTGEPRFLHVLFNPLEPGYHEATVTIHHNDPDGNESPFTFKVGGVGLARSGIQVFRDPFFLLDGRYLEPGRIIQGTRGVLFGGVDLTDPVPELRRTLRIRNNGTAPLTLDPVSDSPAFVFSGLETTIPPNGFDDFEIIYRPLADIEGDHETFVQLNNNSEEIPRYSFPVLAYWTVPRIFVTHGDVRLSNGDSQPHPSDGTDFGETVVLDGMVDQAFFIHNEAEEWGNPLEIDQIHLDSPHYQIIEEPLFPIEPGGYARLVIRFDPEDVGTHPATLVIESNDPDDERRKFEFVVTGEGTGAPAMQVYGRPAGFLDGFLLEDGQETPDLEDGTDFGVFSFNSPINSVTHSFRIHNRGGAPLEVSVSDDSNQFSTSDLAPIIPPGEFDDFNLTYAPTEAETHLVTVTISNNVDPGNPFTFKVRARSFAPEIKVLSLTENEIESGSQFILDSLGTDFGEAPAPNGFISHTFLIENEDGFTDGLVIASITTDSPHFSIGPNLILPISEGEDQRAAFSVRFHPTTPGEHEDTVTIVHNDPDGNEAPFTFTVGGVGTGEPDPDLPEIAVFGVGDPTGEVEIFDGAPLAQISDYSDLGGTTVPNFREQTFRIRNVTPTGGDPNAGTLDISEISVSNPNVFSITSGAPLPLIPIIVPREGFHEFTVRAHPTGPGDFRTTVTIRNNDPDGNEEPFTFSVACHGDNPDITLLGGPNGDVEISNGDESARSEDGTYFGLYQLGSIQPPDPALSHDFVIRNVGGSELTVDLSSDSPDFQVESGGVSLLPNRTYTWFVAFAPTTPGEKEGTITIRTNDPDEDPYTFRVQGSAVGSEINVFGGASLDASIDLNDFDPEAADGTEFGGVSIGSTCSHTFRIANDGNRDLALSLFAPCGRFRRFQRGRCTRGDCAGRVGRLLDHLRTIQPGNTGGHRPHHQRRS